MTAKDKSENYSDDFCSSTRYSISSISRYRFLLSVKMSFSLNQTPTTYSPCILYADI